jgi:hypothetical protein
MMTFKQVGADKKNCDPDFRLGAWCFGLLEMDSMVGAFNTVYHEARI